MRLKTSLLACFLLAACGEPKAQEQFEPGERGRVVRVIDGDALVLDTGQSVRLVGVEAPAKARRDRPAAPHSIESARILEDLTLGRTVRLYYAGLTRDRYDRAIAHVFTDDDLGPPYWVNLELVKRGGARVRTYPDTSKNSAPLWTAEAEAREQQEGLWTLRAYAPLRASELEGDVFGFQILQGVLGQSESMSQGGCKRDFLNSPVALRIESSAIHLCALPQGQKVEARGYLSRGEIEVTHDDNVRIQD